MKILQVITSLQTGGAEKLIVDLVPLYQEHGYQVDVLLFDGTETPFKKQLQDKGITIYQLGQGGSVYNPLYIFKLIPFLRKYDIVHTHNTAPQLYTAIANLFCHSHLITTEHNTLNRRRNWKWYRFIDKWMYNRYDRVICISDKTETNLRKYLKTESPKICTIYNGIDIKHFTEAIPYLNIRTKPSDIIIMMVAGFRYQKDQDTVIKSLSYLPTQYQLYLVGDGVRRPECERLSRQLQVDNRVHFLGIRNDIPELLKASDIVVMSSHFEGFGLAAVEGMAAGKPVIASDVDGLREVVKDAGILFTPGDHQQLAQIIERLTSDQTEYNRIAHRCVNRAQNYDISIMGFNYMNIYHNILQGKN